MPRTFLKIGKAMLTALWDGMKAIWAKMKEWLGAMVEWIKDLNPFKGWGESISEAIKKLQFWKKEVEDEENPVEVNPDKKEFKENLGSGMSDGLGIPKDGNFFKEGDPTVQIPDSLGSSNATTTNNNNNQITINLPDGIYNAEDIASEVSTALDNLYAMADTGQRSALHD